MTRTEMVWLEHSWRMALYRALIVQGMGHADALATVRGTR